MSLVDLQPAYVLHTRHYQDTSLILEILTRDQGRISLLAKGALKSKSGRYALLQPFTPLLIGWRGRGELPVLSRLEAVGSAYPLQGKCLYCGLYVNELVLYLVGRSEPQPALFAHYMRCLLALLESDNTQASFEPVLRRFERDLLNELGVGLNLAHDHKGNLLDQNAYYRYQIQDGFILCDEQYPTRVQGASLLALADDMLESVQQIREVRLLMREVLAYYLQGKSLNSRDLFT